MFQHVVEVSSDDEASDEDRETPRGIFFRRSHRVATLCGVSSKEYRRMRRWPGRRARRHRGAQVYRWAAQDGPRKGLYRIFLYKIQPNQFYTVLLYNRGTEPQVTYWAAIVGGPTA